MAKVRRPPPKATKPNRSGPATRSARDAPSTGPQRPGAPITTDPPRRSTYVDAVALYERGLQALQRHEYQKAADLLDSVLRQYPEERELHERVRLYLNICRRHAAPREASPKTVDERLYAATLAINGGQYDQAIAHLRLV